MKCRFNAQKYAIRAQALAPLADASANHFRSKNTSSNDGQAVSVAILSSTDVAGRLGLVDHTVSSGSWDSYPSGHSLVGKPCQVVAARTVLGRGPRRTGSQLVGETVELRSVGNLVLELDAHLLAGRPPD